MSTNSPGTERSGERSSETGLGWPRRPRISRLLGWPFFSRETPTDEVSRETPPGHTSPEVPPEEVSRETGAGPALAVNSASKENAAATNPAAEVSVVEDDEAPDPDSHTANAAADADVTGVEDAQATEGRAADDMSSGAETAALDQTRESGDPTETTDAGQLYTGESLREAPDGDPGATVDTESAEATSDGGWVAVPDGPPASPGPELDDASGTVGVSQDTGVSAAVGDVDAETEEDGTSVGDVRPRRAMVEAPASPVTPPPVDIDEGTTGPVSRGTARRIELMPTPAQTRTLVVANQKGGVGKTTTSVNLAAALAMGGLSVLVVDLDPQGNASTALGVDHAQGIKGTYEVLIDGEDIATLVVDSPEAPNLKVLPATVDLAGAEIELVSMVARENKLKRALRAYLAEHPTDYVLLDCPPSLGLLTLNALVAAREVLIPIQCEYYALEGVSQLMTTIDLVMAELNEELQLSTVLLTMFDGRTRLASQVADEVRSYFAEQTLPSVIPRSVRISEAPSYGQTVLTYHPDSAGAVSYLEAAREIARRGAEENA